MNITADENIPYVKNAFSSLGTVVTMNGRDINQQHLQQTDILLVRSITNVNKSLLENTPVKFVASATAGFNHINLEYLASQQIGFARAPGSNAISAAEYVFAGICHWSLKEGKTLSDLSIGIIGCGNVGSRVKRLCEAAGLSCIINDPPLADKKNHELAYDFRSIDEVLECDIVTLHIPLSIDGDHPTFRILNKKRINQLKEQTLFINAARGEVVEEPALLARMDQRNDLTLILDVWENEPQINPLMLEHTMIGTPHIAGYSIDGKIRGTEMIYQAVCNYFKITPEWTTENVNFGPDPKSQISLTIEKDIRNDILKAYDITLDDRNLKKILADPLLENGKLFDSLRKNYPPRREYSTLT